MEPWSSGKGDPRTQGPRDPWSRGAQARAAQGPTDRERRETIQASRDLLALGHRHCPTPEQQWSGLPDGQLGDPAGFGVPTM